MTKYAFDHSVSWPQLTGLSSNQSVTVGLGFGINLAANNPARDWDR
jgi:hypothetical protein